MYTFTRDTVMSGVFIYLNTSKFRCNNIVVNTGEIKRAGRYRMFRVFCKHPYDRYVYLWRRVLWWDHQTLF